MGDVTRELAFAHGNNMLKNAFGGISDVIHMPGAGPKPTSETSRPRPANPARPSWAPPWPGWTFRTHEGAPNACPTPAPEVSGADLLAHAVNAKRVGPFAQERSLRRVPGVPHPCAAFDLHDRQVRQVKSTRRVGPRPGAERRPPQWRHTRFGPLNRYRRIAQHELHRRPALPRNAQLPPILGLPLAATGRRAAAGRLRGARPSAATGTAGGRAARRPARAGCCSPGDAAAGPRQRRRPRCLSKRPCSAPPTTC
jgi:hypothetical protein